MNKITPLYEPSADATLDARFHSGRAMVGVFAGLAMFWSLLFAAVYYSGVL